MLSTVPAPVWMPQPSGPTSSSGISAGIFTTLRALTMEWVANDDCPKNEPCTSWPDSLFIVMLPSSRTPAMLSSMKLRQ